MTRTKNDELRLGLETIWSEIDNSNMSEKEKFKLHSSYSLLMGFLHESWVEQFSIDMQLLYPRHESLTK